MRRPPERMERVLDGITALVVGVAMLIILGSLLNYPLLMVSVPTGSMAPAIRPGSLVPVVPLWLRGEPRLGDVVVYRTAERQWIIHRVVGGDAAVGFITRGDANPAPDPEPVRPGQVAGVVPAWGASNPLGPGRVPVLNPILAVVMLGAGFLVFFQTHSGGGGRRRRHRPGGTATAVTYLALAGMVMAATFLVSVGLQETQVYRYVVVEEHPINVEVDAHVHTGVAGSRGVSREVGVENRSVFPMVVAFDQEEADFRYDPPAALLWPRQRHTFTTTATGEAPGIYEGAVRRALYPPFLPAAWVYRLDQVSPFLASAALALVPALAILVIALFDRRFVRELRHLWWRVRVRISV